MKQHEMELHEQVGHTFTPTAINHYLEMNGGPWSTRSPSEIHVCTVCHAIREYLSGRTHREFLPSTASGYYNPPRRPRAREYAVALEERTWDHKLNSSTRYVRAYTATDAVAQIHTELGARYGSGRGPVVVAVGPADSRSEGK